MATVALVTPAVIKLPNVLVPAAAVAEPKATEADILLFCVNPPVVTSG